MNATQTLLLIIAILLAIGIGFMFAQYADTPAVVSEPEVAAEPEVPTENNAESNTSGTSQVSEEGTTVETSSLTEGQRKLLGVLGINADEITITPEMIACAEAKVGKARLEEIQNGATPSFLEGMELVACYR